MTAQSAFSSTANRNKAVRADLEELFEERASSRQGEGSTLDSVLVQLVDAVAGPLLKDPPEASQAAEAALTIAQFSLSEGRLLNVVDPKAGDLNDAGRLDGDRTVGDYLCKNILQPRQIPSTQGPLQSSSFRGGYLSRQVRNDALKRFVQWQSDEGTTLEQLRSFANGIVDIMLEQASRMPEWVDVAASRLSFSAFLRLRERLLATGSGGAFEQYLLAGLMEAELTQSSTSFRVETKSVGANDKATNSPGDIVIRERQAARAAFEVTAASWQSKVSQLETAARQGLTEATIVAPGVPGSMSADQVAAVLEPVGTRLGIDPAVVDLHAYMDVISSRISPHGRAEALSYVYRCLIRWHGRQPELAVRLIGLLKELDLLADTSQSSVRGMDTVYADVTVELLREQLVVEGIVEDPSVPELLRILASELEGLRGD